MINNMLLPSMRSYSIGAWIGLLQQHIHLLRLPSQGHWMNEVSVMRALFVVQLNETSKSMSNVAMTHFLHYPFGPK